MDLLTPVAVKATNNITIQHRYILWCFYCDCTILTQAVPVKGNDNDSDIQPKAYRVFLNFTELVKPPVDTQ